MIFIHFIIEIDKSEKKNGYSKEINNLFDVRCF